MTLCCPLFLRDKQSGIYFSRGRPHWIDCLPLTVHCPCYISLTLWRRSLIEDTGEDTDLNLTIKCILLAVCKPNSIIVLIMPSIERCFSSLHSTDTGCPSKKENYFSRVQTKVCTFVLWKLSKPLTSLTFCYKYLTLQTMTFCYK